MIYTTLNRIREHDPCRDSWVPLLESLHKTRADDEPLSLRHILDTLNLDDALWALRACDGIDREARLYAVACARDVQHLMTDTRSLAVLDVAEHFANGRASVEELAAAGLAAAAAAAWRTAEWSAAAAAATAAAADAAAAAARSAAAAARGALRAKQRERFITMFCTED